MEAQSNAIGRLLLRLFVLLGAVAGTLYFLAIIRWWWLIPSRSRDGFELIGLVLGSIYLMLFVAPSWYFAIKNYALALAAVFASIALLIASDGVFSWIPW